MTYGELQKDLNDGKISGAKIKIHLDRYESTFQEVSRAALKKLIASAFKENCISSESRCLWGTCIDSSKKGALHHVKLNY